MSMYLDYYLDAFRRYAEFAGRATRPQFWYFVLVSFLVSLLIGIILGDKASSLYSLIVFIPSIAIAARRLHDMGKNGWMQLIILIPVIGIIWLIVLLAQPSVAQDNAYGPYVPPRGDGGAPGIGADTSPQE